jgi:hypothetical protein
MKHALKRNQSLKISASLFCLAAPVLLMNYNTATANDFAEPVALTDLATQRGGDANPLLNLTAASSQLQGQSNGNTAIYTNSGANIIGAGALSGMNGHATVIQNSGNNNVIQNSTIYNFSLHH